MTGDLFFLLIFVLGFLAVLLIGGFIADGADERDARRRNRHG